MLGHRIVMSFLLIMACFVVGTTVIGCGCNDDESDCFDDCLCRDVCAPDGSIEAGVNAGTGGGSGGTGGIDSSVIGNDSSQAGSDGSEAGSGGTNDDACTPDDSGTC